jgi:hypothetical protein
MTKNYINFNIKNCLKPISDSSCVRGKKQEGRNKIRVIHTWHSLSYFTILHIESCIGIMVLGDGRKGGIGIWQ